MDRTFYRDRSVQVTSAVVEVDGRAFRLADFQRVWHRTGERSWRALAGRGAIGVAMLIPVVLAVIGIVVALSLELTRAATVGVVAGAVLVGLLFGPLADVLLEHLDRSYARGSREVEIWAVWRGRPVLLLRTGDRLRFGKIYRAIQRAMEAPVASGHR